MLSVRSSLLAAIVFFAGPACADDLNADQIRQLISGKTVYMETTANSETRAAGAAHQFFAADGSVLFKTAKGELWTGTWSIHNGRPRSADSVNASSAPSTSPLNSCDTKLGQFSTSSLAHGLRSRVLTQGAAECVGLLHQRLARHDL
jgi:hypothetical protein